MTSNDFEVGQNKPQEAENTSEGTSQKPAEGDKVKKALLTNIRHDLRTPINAIIGYSEMLLEDAEKLGRNEFVADINKIHTAGKQLLDLVNDIFNPSKVEAGNIDLGSEVFEAKIRQELRTPLNTVIGYTEILLEEGKDLVPQEFLSDLQRISTASKRLFDFLDEIVRISKVETSKLEIALQTPDNSNLVRDTIATLRFLSERGADPKNITPGSVLVVDDNEMNRDLLSRYLERQSYKVATSENGRDALNLMATMTFDLVLLDIIMPKLNGYQVLQSMKENEDLRHIPVIMVSALDEIESVVRCITMGATDYLAKPINPVLLQARVNASLATKRMHDMEQAHLEQIKAEQDKSEKLLLNILPKPIAERLKRGEIDIADYFPECTVLFADLVGFTAHAARHSPAEVVQRLNTIFSSFDKLAEKYQLEKIKTIGDGYMVAGGVPLPRDDHAAAVANMALGMQREISRLNETETEPIHLRIGINSGSLVAGIIGTKKFAYDLWGDTVNVASRIESNGVSDGVLVSEATYSRLRGSYLFKPHGKINLKGKGEVMTYLLTGISA